MELLKSVWAYLDGNKSIICLAIFNLLGLDAVKEVINPDWVEALREVFKYLTGGALTHHMIKGALKKE